MKKILLTGKNGQLGREIIKEARSFGFDIFAFDKDDLDITDKEKLEEKIRDIKPDILINTAAYNSLLKCEEYPFFAMSVNFLAVANLSRLCKEYKIKFVTYSTDYVFDGKKNDSYTEVDIPNPLQIYAMSKLAGEHAVLDIYPENSFIIRTCGIFGGKTGSPEKNGNFVLNIIKEAQDKNSLEISSEQIVSPTYAGDLSKATLKLLSSIQAECGIYHLVNEGFCSWHEFAQEIFDILKIKTKIIPVNRQGNVANIKKPRFSVLKNTKAKSIGIVLPSWKEGLNFYLNNDLK